MATKKKIEKKLPMGFSERGNGTLQYRFTIDGKRYYVYGTTIKECRVKELEKRQAIEDQIEETRKGLTIEKYLDNWIEYRIDIGAIKGATARTYKKILNRIKRTEIDAAGTKFGQIRLTQVEAQHCKDLQKALRKDLTTRTANDSMSLLKKAFEAAKNEHMIKWNPCDTVERLKRSEEPARDNIHRCLTEEELQSFLDAAEGTWYYNLYSFLLHTGMRIGEASALYKTDIKGNIASVTKTVTRTEIGYVIADQTKTEAGRRTVPLRPEAKAAIENQSMVYRMQHGDKVVEINVPIFRMPKGNIIRPDRVNTDIAKICEKAAAKWVYVENPSEIEEGTAFYKGTSITGTSTKGAVFPCSGIKNAKAGDMYLNTDTMNMYRCISGGSAAGIEKFTCHAFRATFTSRCVANGMPVKELMEILGHTDVKMTLGLYAHSNEDLKMESLLAVNI